MRIIKFYLLTSLLVLFSCSKEESRPNIITFPSGEEVSIEKLNTDIAGLSNTYATIKTIHGNIVFRFYTKTAPKTSARIMQLIQSKFYDGLSIHRAIPNFIIQTGDPTGTGTGGSGQRLAPEFSKIQHIKGTVAMAKSTEANSADSQFYIALTTLPHLDGKFTVFGQVVEGLDILDKLAKGDQIISIDLNLKD